MGDGYFYVEMGKSYEYIFSDADVIHYDSWCYPYTIFTVRDELGNALTESLDYVQSITSNEDQVLERINYEQWADDPRWTEDKY